MKALKQAFLLGACLIAVTGCQNHIRHEVLKEKKISRSTPQVTKEIYTPYRGVYSFYEFPSGILILPGAVVVNAVDFVLLGLLPNHLKDDLLDLSFTGINPCLNWESEKRSKSNMLSTETKEVDKRNEVICYKLKV